MEMVARAGAGGEGGNANRTGVEVLLEILRGHGVNTIFGAGGSSVIPLTDALLDAKDFRYILTTHEFCTVAMADAYARASNSPGVAAVHVGPGTTNGLGAMFSAMRERSPLIVLCGQRDTRILGRDSLNEIRDMVEVPRQCAKWCVQVERPDRLPEVMARALQISLSPPQGPVFISLPKDVLRGNVPQGAKETGIRGDATPKLRGDPDRLGEIAKRLQRAERPLIIMGSGVARSRASQQMVALAEKIGAPVVSEVPFSSLWDFPVDHPLYQGDLLPRSPMVSEADLLLAVGGSIFQEKDYTPEEVLPSDIPLLQIHPDPWEIGKMFPVDVAVIADEGTALADLVDLLDANPKDKTLVASRIAEYRERKEAMRTTLEERAKTGWGEAPLKAWQVVKETMEVVGPDAIVIEECVTAAESVRAFGNTGTLIPENRAGHLGWGISGAIGTKLAHPDRPVVAFLGDGASMFGIQGLWTAAKYRVPVLFVVFRNRAYMVDRSQKAWERGDYIGTDLGDPDIQFADLARSLGLKGIRVEAPDDLRPSMESALASGQPALVECIMEEKNARRIFEDIQWQPWLAVHSSAKEVDPSGP
jgi:benzoylformate decarboxylase